MCYFSCKWVYGDKNPLGVALCVPSIDLEQFRTLLKSYFFCLEQEGGKCFLEKQRKLNETRAQLS